MQRLESSLAQLERHLGNATRSASQKQQAEAIASTVVRAIAALREVESEQLPPSQAAQLAELIQELETSVSSATTLLQGSSNLKSLAAPFGHKKRVKQILLHLAGLAEAAQQLRSTVSSEQRPEQADPIAAPQTSQTQLSGREELRKGGKTQTMKALLYIPADRSSGNFALSGQLWYASAGRWSKLVTKRIDLATGARSLVADGFAVSCLHLDSANNVWAGMDNGTLVVLAESTAAPLCAPLKITASAITSIMSDAACVAWVGCDKGRISRLELAAADSYSRTRTPKLQPLPLHPPARVSAGASDPYGQLCHPGRVCSIAMHAERCWSAGGTSSNSTILEWSEDSRVKAQVNSSEAGYVTGLVVLPLFADRTSQSSGSKPGQSADSKPGLSNDSKQEQGSDPTSSAASQGSGMLSDWILATAHSSGAVLLWETRLGGLSVLATLRVPSPTDGACKSLWVCQPLGLWCAAYASGRISMRTLRALGLSQGQSEPPGRADPLPLVCFLQGERNTLLMVGGESGLFTASEGGTVTAWPESDLRAAVEGAGFAVPNRVEARREATRLRSKAKMAKTIAQATMLCPVPGVSGAGNSPLPVSS